MSINLGRIVAIKKYKQYKIVTYLHNFRYSNFEVEAAYTLKNKCIGDPILAHFLVVERGIKPELANKSHRICSVGFCKKEQKWYAWSHRAMWGFGVGDFVQKGDALSKTFSVGFKAKTLKDAKRMAIVFAKLLA